jgi:hypothetical protein
MYGLSVRHFLMRRKTLFAETIYPLVNLMISPKEVNQIQV